MIVLLLTACSGGAHSKREDARTAPPVTGGRCFDLGLVPAPSWSGWRDSGKADPCERLTRCARAGCEQATCLHRHYGCLDSGTTARIQEGKLGADYFVTIGCCPEYPQGTGTSVSGGCGVIGELRLRGTRPQARARDSRRAPPTRRDAPPCRAADSEPHRARRPRGVPRGSRRRWPTPQSSSVWPRLSRCFGSWRLDARDVRRWRGHDHGATALRQLPTTMAKLWDIAYQRVDLRARIEREERDALGVRHISPGRFHQRMRRCVDYAPIASA